MPFQSVSRLCCRSLLGAASSSSCTKRRTTIVAIDRRLFSNSAFHIQPANATARSVLVTHSSRYHHRNLRQNASFISNMSTTATMNGSDKSSDFVTTVSATPAEVEDLLAYVLEQVRCQNIVCGRMTKKTKVVDFVHPAELEKLLGLTTAGMGIGKDTAKKEELEEICDKVIRYSVKTTHPHFYNQLYHGVDGYGLAAAWLTEALNTNGHTFEVAPVFTVAERAVIRYIMGKFGFDPDVGDGIFAPGGSLANMYGMVLARHFKYPETKTKGLRCLSGDLVAFTSEESHYSVVKGANWLGLGVEGVVKVKTDSWGRMTPEALEEAVQKTKSEGKLPFFVNATIGSTVMGANEELDRLSEVCKKHGLWLHVDACWGGPAIFSKKYKHLLKGSDQVDSIAWNIHKMIGAPLQCSVFITRHKGLLHQTNCASATYLFQQDKFYDVTYDTGDKSMQCGRKTEGFKAWFMLKARGEDYLERLVDNNFAAAEYLIERIGATDGFRMAFEGFGFDGGAHCTNVCFEYVPPSLRGQDEDEEWRERLAAVPPKIKEAMTMRGSMMIGYQPLPHKNKKNFFRFVIPSQPPPTKEDMDFVIQEIDRCGKEL